MNKTRTWRKVNDPEEIHQYRETGGGLLLGAVLAACGPSLKPDKQGQFWWNVSSERNGYVDTLEKAKVKIHEEIDRLDAL